MATIISIASHKGGVAKTTSSINLAGALAGKDKKVLVIDMDPQANASLIISKENPQTIKNTVAELLTGATTIRNCILSSTNIPGVHLIPSNIRLMKVEEKIRQNSYTIVTNLSNPILEIQDEYDFILIDCPPSLNLLPANALVASDYYIMPINSGSEFSLVGIDDMVEFEQKLLGSNKKLSLLGVLLVSHDARRTVCQTTLAVIQDRGFPYFNSTISSSTKVEQAHQRHRSIVQYDRTSRVAKEYVELASEIIATIEAKFKAKAVK